MFLLISPNQPKLCLKPVDTLATDDFKLVSMNLVELMVVFVYVVSVQTEA